MKFPNLKVPGSELEENKIAEGSLVRKLRCLFKEYYSLEPPIRISGSTEKGTVLPRKYFGIDVDAAVLADGDLVDRIAYRSDLFEGCQLFSLDFFERFRRVFPDAYFAGHRLSGTVMSVPFDFAIADKDKDMWKWDYNSSKYLKFDDGQIEEIKKVKFFLKRFNVSGSEVYGIVGPAVELGIYARESFHRFIEMLREIPRFTEQDMQARFRTVRFPSAFYDLFLEEENEIHRGLVNSFRYTTPNTFNRVIEAAGLDSLNPERFIDTHQPTLNYRRRLKNKNDRAVLYFISAASNKAFEDVNDLQLLKDRRGIIIYASLGNQSKHSLTDLCDKIDRVPLRGDISKRDLDEKTRGRIETSLGGRRDYVVFVGQPESEVNKELVYIPFDILIRGDAEKLIRVMVEGQHGTQ